MAVFTGSFYAEGIHYKDTAQFKPETLHSGVVLYEVVRILNKSALFLEDHIQRLQESVNLSGYLYSVSVPVIHYLLRNLIKKNDISNGNVKINLKFQADHPPELISFFIPHVYPSPEMYQAGVESDLFMGARTNPNVKQLHPDMHRRVTDFIHSEGLYDALLVDEHGNVSEGSRTNAFFIRGNSVYTAPGEQVLKGITREKVRLLCHSLNIPCLEEEISIGHLHTFEAAFFTGTSPKILPIRRIANIAYAVPHPVMKTLMEAYDDLIVSYLYRW